MNSREWREVKLGEVCEFQEGYVNPSQKVPEYFGNEIKWIRANDLNNRYVFDTSRKLSIKGFKSAGKSALLFEPDSIVISKSGTIGRLGIIKDYMCGNRATINIKIKKDIADYRFIFYHLLSKQSEIEDLAVGSVQRNLYTSILGSIYIVLPPLPEQKAIAATLSCLDDKIEINNRINRTLEEMAQAIFKSWFIDFEPFQDGEFEDSELGRIPKGWRVGTVSDLGNVVGGSTPSKACADYYTDNGIAWITPKDLSINKNKFISKGEIDITDLGLKNSSAKIMPKGTVLFSSRAPIGYIAIAKNEVTTNQGFKSVVPKNNIGTAYVYYFLKTNTELIESMASGSTFKEVSGSTMKQIPALIPDDKILMDFQHVCATCFEMQMYLESQNQTLAGIRDTLLPKLMSGEIRVPVEEVQ